MDILGRFSINVAFSCIFRLFGSFPLASRFYSRQFLLFIVSGAFAAAVNFFSRILYSFWLEFSVAVLVAYLTGMVTAFFLFRAFVFSRSATSLSHSAFFFVVVNLIAVSQTWVVSLLAAYYVLPSLGVHDFVHEIAHGIGILVPVFTSYLGHKYWSFRE